MGNVCCVVENEKKETVKSANGPLKRVSETEEAFVAPSEAELKAFKDRLENSINMTVVIADGKRIPCRLRWQPSDSCLVMSCDVNNHLHIRRMSLDELVTVISGRKDLGRVATKANIVDEPNCVALHLASNTCIPIVLESLTDKNCFLHFMTQLKQKSA